MSVDLGVAKKFCPLKIEAGRSVKIVVGNESCDLDSVACALAYASLLTFENNRNHSHSAIFPILNTYRKDLKIKTEVVYYLNKFRVSEDNLYFRDDFDEFLSLGKNKQLEVVLVDHNFNATFSEWVVEVIDHHPLSFEYPSSVEITLDLVGSCASLVLHKISTSKEGYCINAKLAHMLYGAILIDTNNLSEVTQRWKQLDLDMLLAIEPLVLNDDIKSPTDYFNHVHSIKSNIDWMSPTDLLVKDLKITKGLPVCSLPILVQMYATRDSVEKALISYCMQTNTEEIVLMGLHIQDGSVSKDIGFFSVSDTTKMDKLAIELQKLTEPKLMLTRINEQCCSIKGLAIYNVNNLLITRKHVLPAITNILNNF